MVLGKRKQDVSAEAFLATDNAALIASADGDVGTLTKLRSKLESLKEDVESALASAK